MKTWNLVASVVGTIVIAALFCAVIAEAGSIDNAATRPWVQSLIDYVTGTVVPTSSVAHATSADDALYIGTGLDDSLTALYYEEAGVPLYHFSSFGTYGDDARTNELTVSPSDGSLYYMGAAAGLSWYFVRDGTYLWTLGFGDSGSGAYQYTFGNGGNVITQGMTGVTLSGTLTPTNVLEGYVGTNDWRAYTGQVASVCFSDPVTTLDATRSNVTWVVLDTSRAFVPTSILTHARSGVSTQIWLWAYATNTAWDTTNGVIVTSPVSNIFYSAAVSYGTIPAHSRIGTIWNEAITSITNAVGQLSGYEIP